MKFKVQIVVESESGETQFIQEVAQIEKGHLQPDNLGLTLEQAKELLQKTQRTIAVATCNTNRSNLQSRHFPTGIKGLGNFW